MFALWLYLRGIITYIHVCIYIYIVFSSYIYVSTYMHVCVFDIPWCHMFVHRQLSAKFFEFGMPCDLEKVTRATFRTLGCNCRNLPKNGIMFCVNLWAIEVDLSPFKVCHRWCFLEDDVGVLTVKTFKFVLSVFDWLFLRAQQKSSKFQQSVCCRLDRAMYYCLVTSHIVWVQRRPRPQRPKSRSRGRASAKAIWFSGKKTFSRNVFDWGFGEAMKHYSCYMLLVNSWSLSHCSKVGHQFCEAKCSVIWVYFCWGANLICNIRS